MSTGKGRIRESTENGVSERIPEMWDPGEYREGRIRASIGEGKIRVSTGKGRIRASIRKNRNLGEYQRRARMSTGRRIGEGVESGRVPKNHQIKKG